MNESQFTALTQLLRLRAGSTREAVRLHLVQGLSVPDAARAAAVDYQLALKAVRRAKDGYKLIVAASGSFAALAKLLRLRPGPAQEAVRLHLVQGLNVPDSARAAGFDYQLALKAIKRAKDGYKLVVAVTSP